RLDLALAKLPFGDGPLVIRRLILTDPAIHLIRTPQGLIGQHALVKDEAPAPPPAAEAEAPRYLLSQMFELRLVRIGGGRVVYEDRTAAGSVPAVWRNIDVRLETDPTSNPLYRFAFAAGARPAADLVASGTFHID